MSGETTELWLSQSGRKAHPLDFYQLLHAYHHAACADATTVTGFARPNREAVAANEERHAPLD